MSLPVEPPVAPMLAKLARELPGDGGGYLYEPKWDGFRCLAFRDGDDVDLRSRHGKPLARYFPELVAALRQLSEPRLVLDGEILVTLDGRFDFSSLLNRLHPAASRVERLRAETPASYVAFDVLAVGDEDLTGRPFEERRAALEHAMRDAEPPLHLTPATGDVETARTWLEGFGGGGLDGVMAKPRDLPYQPGKRAMVKVKHERTADCVVAGFRWLMTDPVVGSLLLGLYDDGDRDGTAGRPLRHVGITSSFTNRQRAELVDHLAPHVTELAGHPWEHGFGLDVSPVGRLPGSVSRWTPGHEQTWVPLEPVLVCEVAFDHVDGGRFRHPAKFRRWRPDREATSCTFDQLPDDDRPEQLPTVLTAPTGAAR